MMAFSWKCGRLDSGTNALPGGLIFFGPRFDAKAQKKVSEI
jgi:hypothetical protein